MRETIARGRWGQGLAHRLTMRDGRIVEDTVHCGGGRPAALLAEMAEASPDGAG